VLGHIATDGSRPNTETVGGLSVLSLLRYRISADCGADGPKQLCCPIGEKLVVYVCGKRLKYNRINEVLRDHWFDGSGSNDLRITKIHVGRRISYHAISVADKRCSICYIIHLLASDAIRRKKTLGIDMVILNLLPGNNRQTPATWPKISVFCDSNKDIIPL
jgi:hypothetical protein